MITITFNPAEWRLVPERPTQEMCDAAKYTVHAGLSVFKWADGYYAMLAAAPQPPEAYSNSTEFDGIKPEAAPVQLPEPQAEIEVRSMKTYLDLSIHEWRDTLPDGTYKVYTEKQVRQLLAEKESND